MCYVCIYICMFGTLFTITLSTSFMIKHPSSAVLDVDDGRTILCKFYTTPLLSSLILYLTKIALTNRTMVMLGDDSRANNRTLLILSVDVSENDLSGH